MQHWWLHQMYMRHTRTALPEVFTTRKCEVANTLGKVRHGLWKPSGNPTGLWGYILCLRLWTPQTYCFKCRMYNLDGYDWNLKKLWKSNSSTYPGIPQQFESLLVFTGLVRMFAAYSSCFPKAYVHRFQSWFYGCLDLLSIVSNFFWLGCKIAH